ncbi:curlin [Aureimonas sp. AU40]|uniref:curlin n=1 Tax=Aureimonas sp. AU40 TaxID=1637747 RepID=UPI00078089D6|nr:curlin [Aureimonas sp. AU40]
MIRNLLKPLSLALALAGLAPLASPAQAGGQVSWDLAPADRGQADALSMGMRLYAIGRELRNGSIDQNGLSNVAGLAQRGHGNLGLIRQRGNGHSATLQQNGDDNSYALFQFGRNADDAVVQNGNGRSGARVTYGW